MYFILSIIFAALVGSLMLLTSTAVGKKYENNPLLNAVTVGLCVCAIVSSSLFVANVNLPLASCRNATPSTTHLQSS